MALIGNGYRHNLIGKLFGATAIDGANPSVHLYSGHKSGTCRNMFDGEGITSNKSSVPDGSRHPASWIMAKSAGGMAAYGGVSGSGGITPAMILALDAEALIDGDGGITAFGGLIVNMIASIAGSGGVITADMKAFLQLAATIAGAGGVATASQLRGLGALAATIVGSGSAVSTATGIGALGATLRGYGDVTPEGIRDAVWSAILAKYPDAGTAGKALSQASAGGVDLDAMAQAVWDHTQ